MSHVPVATTSSPNLNPFGFPSPQKSDEHHFPIGLTRSVCVIFFFKVLEMAKVLDNYYIGKSSILSRATKTGHQKVAKMEDSSWGIKPRNIHQEGQGMDWFKRP